MEEILDSDLQKALIIILNLIIIESLLSVDNAAVIATMVDDLPEKQKKKALKYGIFGAFVFRGLCLLFASWLVNIWWLKPLGGIYLLWLAIDHFKDKLRYGLPGTDFLKLVTIAAFLFTVHADATISILGFDFNLFWIVQLVLVLYGLYLGWSLLVLPKDVMDDEKLNKSNNLVYRFFQDKIGKFWSTVILVEIMDLALSVDNVFAAVAFTENMNLIYFGVFVGMLAMRFVAQRFVDLMEKYKFLKDSAFLVILILGLKLGLSIISHTYSESLYAKIMESELADMLVSLLTISCFIVPLGKVKFHQWFK